VGKVRATLPAGVLERSELATLQIIKDNLGGPRPIYFSRTTGNYPDRIGLTPYLFGQGIARKLYTDSIAPADSVGFVGGLGWVQLPRSRQLLFDVYHTESPTRQRPRGWVDTPSEGILSLYWIMYAAWGQIAKAQADTTRKPPIKADPAVVATGKIAEGIAEKILVNTSFGRQRAVTGASLQQ
jgi:hypothetical protein